MRFMRTKVISQLVFLQGRASRLTEVQYLHESPQCQLSAKWSWGQAWHSVGVSAVQCRVTAVPGGHWSHIRTSEVAGSRYWYFGGMSCSWKAQDREAVTSCKAEQEGGGGGGEREDNAESHFESGAKQRWQIL